jgi:hypothetical protein
MARAVSAAKPARPAGEPEPPGMVVDAEGGVRLSTGEVISAAELQGWAEGLRRLRAELEREAEAAGGRA